MKFKVTLKDPDALRDAIEDVVTVQVNGIMGLNTEDEIESVISTRVEKVIDKCAYWFEYQELVTLEIDTDKMTCVVVSR